MLTYVGLMNDRAKLADLPCGDSFLGSKYFPRSLLNTCASHDPKSILFRDSPLPSLPIPPSERSRLQAELEPRIRGKKLLLLSGGADTLVPHKNSEGFVRVLEELGVDVKDMVFESVGHKFAAPMVEPAVEFLVKAVRDEEGGKDRARI